MKFDLKSFVKPLAANAKRTYNLTKLLVKEKQPEIYLGLGIAGGIGAAIMACKSTSKASEILKEHREESARIEEVANNTEIYGAKYTEEYHIKDVVQLYGLTVAKLLVAYGPALLLGTGSILSLLQSNRVSRKRNVMLATTLMSVEKSFEEYRKNVTATDPDTAKKAVFDQDIVAEDENGNIVVKGEDLDSLNKNVYNPYAFVFDPKNSVGVNCCPSDDKFWIQMKFSELTDRMRAKGHMFFNEVRYEFDVEDDMEVGQTCGWIFDYKNPDRANFVDAEITEIQVSDNKGTHRAYLLEFNCDGQILGALQAKKQRERE